MGKGVTWPVLVSPDDGAKGAAELSLSVGGSGRSSAGAVPAAELMDETPPPNKRVQSDGVGAIFQMFEGASSSTPT